MNDSSSALKSSKTLSRRSRSKSRKELNTSTHSNGSNRPYSWRDLPTGSSHSKVGKSRGRSNSKSKRILTGSSHHSNKSRARGLSSSIHSKSMSKSRSRSRDGRGSSLNVTALVFWFITGVAMLVIGPPEPNPLAFDNPSSRWNSMRASQPAAAAEPEKVEQNDEAVEDAAKDEGEEE